MLNAEDAARASVIPEALRAWVGANDAPSLWPHATRERLWSLDPRVAAIVASIFAHELAP